MSRPEDAENADVRRDTPSSRSLEQAEKLCWILLGRVPFPPIVEGVARTLDAARAEGWIAAVKALREPHGLMIGHVARQHRYEQDALGYMRRAADWLADNKNKSEERTSSPNDGVAEG